MIKSIIKRDGRVVLYDQNKIASAILRAMEVSHEGDAGDAARVANDVQGELERRFPSQAPNIEAIQDAVERQLMNHGFNAAAKAYILYRANRTRAREANTSLMRTGKDRQILSGIAKYYKPEELIGKTLVAITNLPPRKMMGRESCGMLLSAVHTEQGEEKLQLLMVSDTIPAGAKLC